ncbi:AAA family ATPase [Paraflavitalea sp. CAU 1676]|uniref:AAA family ATPase n=1 Tax=Paraflavitalea sp. CAU 1676 TaxID=3032598 RepID=UPI0023D994ED|nr:AAA family ATPase [Paraflavitalea sp. CAU 1676]MDF2191053.1 AAA family ATPase [Paraflavitalea sp. CAU 1676]
MKKKGLVLGKFMPLHAGHLAMIDFALLYCEHLVVMLCASEKEQIGGQVRKGWLEESFGDNERVSVALVEYDEAVLPNSSVSSRSISALWANYIRNHFAGIEVFVSSEPYGDYVAEFLGIEHVCFDQARKQVPVAASSILRNPFEHWDLIAPAARPWFVKKICLSGSESTGKSTLAERLGNYFTTSFVPEMAREVIETTDEVVFEDLLKIATLHAATINEKVREANRILVCDTDVNITKSYSKYLFGRELVVPDWIEAANRFDLHIFLDTDCPHVQDGTRLQESERNALSRFHEQQLMDAGIPYVMVGGNWEERFERAKAEIEQVFFNNRII